MSPAVVVEVVCHVIAGAVATIEWDRSGPGRCMTGTGRRRRRGLRLRQPCWRIEHVDVQLRPPPGGLLAGDRCHHSGGIHLRRHRPQFSGRCTRPGRRVGDYDPTTGTFLTRDPHPEGEPPGTTVHTNPYAYVRNDPLNLMDPKGLRATDVVFQQQSNDPCESDPFLPSESELAASSLDVGGSPAQERAAELANCREDYARIDPSTGKAPDTRIAWSGHTTGIPGTVSSLAAQGAECLRMTLVEACAFAAVFALPAQNLAMQVTQNDPRPRVKGPSGVNAVRHFVWTALISSAETKINVIDAIGKHRAKGAAEIHERFQAQCNGTRQECRWDNFADAHNNDLGLDFGEQIQDVFPGDQMMRIKQQVERYLNEPGGLDLRGGCPSRHWSVPQGC